MIRSMASLLKPRTSKVTRALWLCLFLWIARPPVLAQSLTAHVNPWMGVSGTGNTVIGPQLPWGSINPSPDTPEGHTDGYHPGKKIRGFSQLHVSGTGGPGKYGQFLISPQIGLRTGETEHDSAKGEEEPTVASYKVRLTDYDILCELTPTTHAAIYRFTFPQSEDSHLSLDLGHNIPGNAGPVPGGGYADEGEVVVDARQQTICGWGNYWGGWSAEPFKVYFAARYDQPADGFGTWKDDVIAPDISSQKIVKKSERIGCYLRYRTKKDQVVRLKIAVSFMGVEQAFAYLDQEIPAWDFEKTRAAADRAWDRQLKKITVEGATADQQAVFYTSLHNTMRMPRNRTGDNPRWKSSEPYWDDHYCVWDTWKTLFPLQVLINESMVRDNVKAFLDRFKENGRVLDAFIAGNDRFYEWRAGDDRVAWLGDQGGNDVTNVIADAYVKGVEGIDWAAAYRLLKESADHERAASYRAQGRGWVPYRTHEFGLPCSRTLEFCYNDFCAAQVAKGLGQTQDFVRYLKRSRGWENLWNPAAESDGFKGFIMPRTMAGAWVESDPKKDRAVSSPGTFDRSFYEGSSWTYSFFLPHDFARIIGLAGGREAYVAKLEHALQNKMINFGNEPSFLTPFSFIYAGRPDLASFWVRRNVRNYTKDRFPGDEDSGAMGSWLVFAAMGLFPNAGQDIYLLNGPLYPKMTVMMENGKQFIIEGNNASPENVYVQSATLNGRSLEQAWLRHADLKNGAILKFVMGPQPSPWGQAAVPPPVASLAEH